MSLALEQTEFAVESDGKDTGVVRVRGEVDTSTAHVVETHLNEQVDRGSRSLVLDVAELTFIDAAGLAAIVRVLNRLDGSPGRIVLRSPDRRFRRLLVLTGLEQFLPCEVTPEKG